MTDRWTTFKSKTWPCHSEYLTYLNISSHSLYSCFQWVVLICVCLVLGLSLFSISYRGVTLVRSHMAVSVPSGCVSVQLAVRKSFIPFNSSFQSSEVMLTLGFCLMVECVHISFTHTRTSSTSLSALVNQRLKCHHTLSKHQFPE